MIESSFHLLGFGGGGGGSGGGSGKRKYNNCNDRIIAELEDDHACPIPCSPGEHQDWAAGTHESQTGQNDKLIHKYKDYLFSCFGRAFKLDKFIS